MRTPTAQHIEGFFLGMEHAERVANQNKRGDTSAQVIAIRREYTTLALLAARPANERRPQGDAIGRQLSSPQNPKPHRGAFLAACALVGEFTVAMLIVGGPFIAAWGYFIFTGLPLDFGGTP